MLQTLPLSDSFGSHWVVGNWKMNGSYSFIENWVKQLPDLSHLSLKGMICPPTPYLDTVARALGSMNTMLMWGAQDCDPDSSSERTGNISASMLADLGCSGVILGHSERRQYAQESSHLIQKKAHAAVRKGVIPIICVGETDKQRQKGQIQEILSEQLENSLPLTGSKILVAYEPCWAIGTGQVPSREEILEIYDFIKDYIKKNRKFEKCSVLYGGSVTLENSESIFDIVDGVLVGRSSLDAKNFGSILLKSHEKRFPKSMINGRHGRINT